LARQRSAAVRVATRSSGAANPLRWIGYFGECLIVGVLAMQVYFFLQIAAWQYLNPSSTSFLRAERWRLCGFNFWSCTVDHKWVSYDEMSRNIKRAVIASEDADFVNHPGYELDAMLDAWERNKQRGRIVRGGSTITQQLAKNLFLASEQYYVRKGQELAITWMLEFWLDKQRIFEIYLNSVEWGEGVFGVEAAAQHYFHTSASKLTVGQAARLAAALPAPKCFDKKQYCANVHVNFRAKASIIARRMGAATLPD
jgi:monofunctional biosynthetic peptidoglycan transglycosylase